MAELEDGWGARWGLSFEGWKVVRDYGNPGAERQALANGCGIFMGSRHDRLDLAGADRQRFLHGLTTCDVKALAPGRGAYGFFTDSKGKVMADVLVLALTDRLRLELLPDSSSFIQEHMQKYIIADRVEMERRDEELAVSILGPNSESFLKQRLGLSLPQEAWGHASLTLDVCPVAVIRNGHPWCTGFTVWMPRLQAVDLVRKLVGDGASAVPVGWDAVDALRVERGVPRFGPDFGVDCFPQETGLENEAVSYEKGCYLGQEIVARIHYRGQANRVMTRVSIEGGEMPAIGTPVSEGGREAGRLGTVVSASEPGGPGFGGLRAFALIQRRASEPGTSLSLPDGRTATVIDALSP